MPVGVLAADGVSRRSSAGGASRAEAAVVVPEAEDEEGRMMAHDRRTWSPIFGIVRMVLFSLTILLPWAIWCAAAGRRAGSSAAGAAGVGLGGCSLILAFGLVYAEDVIESGGKSKVAGRPHRGIV